VTEDRPASVDVEKLVFQNFADITAFAKQFLRNYESLVADASDIAAVDVGAMFLFVDKRFEL
jgi:hypothetical protein